MDITYTKTGEVRIVSKGLSVAINPAKGSKQDVALFAAGSDSTEPGLTVFSGPGEYEVKGCMIDGIAFTSGATAFSIASEGLRLTFLPGLPEEGDKDLEALTGADVLFVPLHGNKIEQVSKSVSNMDPRVVIPVSYSDDELKSFLDEMGAKGLAPVDKLKLQRKDVPEDKLEVVVLSS